MKKGDLLFCYGTLRIGESNCLAEGRMSKEVEYHGSSCINGELYNLGWYPGARVHQPFFSDDKSMIHGDIFRIMTDRVVASLDSYEGYPHLYGRTETKTKDGDTVWVYTYNGNVETRARIPSGDWKERTSEAA